MYFLPVSGRATLANMIASGLRVLSSKLCERSMMLGARFGLSCNCQVMTRRLQRDLYVQYFLARIAARGSALSMSTFAERKSCLKSNGCLRDSTSDFLILRRCFMTR